MHRHCSAPRLTVVGKGKCSVKTLLLRIVAKYLKADPGSLISPNSGSSRSAQLSLRYRVNLILLPWPGPPLGAAQASVWGCEPMSAGQGLRALLGCSRRVFQREKWALVRQGAPCRDLRFSPGKPDRHISGSTFLIQSIDFKS